MPETGGVTVLKPAQEASGSQIPAPEELIARARAMIPDLRARASDCEKIRKIPDRTIAEMTAAGLFNVCKPKKYGGYEMDYEVLCRIVMELAKGCASSAWIYAVFAEHNNTAAGFPDAAQADLWADDPDVLISSGSVTGTRYSIDKTPILTPVDGGYTLGGQVTFCSGCDHAGWLTTAAILEGPDQTRLQILAPFTKDDIIDDWQVAALAGTGSKIIDFQETFIPDHRTFPANDSLAGRAPGASLYDHPVFRMPRLAMAPFSLVSVAVGIAEGAIGQYAEETKTKVNRFGDSVVDFQSLHMRLGEAAAEHRAAKLLILNDLSEMNDLVAKRETVPLEMRLRNRRDMAYCCQLAASAVDKLYYASGANAMLLANDIQRQFRDVHAAGSHQFLHWDVYRTAWGRNALGLDHELKVL